MAFVRNVGFDLSREIGKASPEGAAVKGAASVIKRA